MFFDFGRVFRYDLVMYFHILSCFSILLSTWMCIWREVTAWLKSLKNSKLYTYIRKIILIFGDFYDTISFIFKFFLNCHPFFEACEFRFTREIV